MVSLADARRVIAAAEKKAAEIGQPMNIAVADEGGNIVSHVRMDGAWIGSIDISMKIFAGGIPLKRDGKVVGAVGVSGGSGDQDHAVAEAGAKAF
jgi:uncharacterized protein GlcG (DUF336 family)